MITLLVSNSNIYTPDYSIFTGATPLEVALLAFLEGRESWQICNVEGGLDLGITDYELYREIKDIWQDLERINHQPEILQELIDNTL